MLVFDKRHLSAFRIWQEFTSQYNPVHLARLSHIFFILWLLLRNIFFRPVKDLSPSPLPPHVVCGESVMVVQPIVDPDPIRGYPATVLGSQGFHGYGVVIDYTALVSGYTVQPLGSQKLLSQQGIVRSKTATG
jgi:hypothetical protein